MARVNKVPEHQSLGNLLDRFLRRGFFLPNAVVDWISFGGMTFNLADVFLVAGPTTLLLSSAPDDPVNRPHHSSNHPDGQG